MPIKRIEESATAVHGISLQDVKYKLFFQESKEFEDLLEFSRATTFVCHNAEYDLKVLAQEGIIPRFYICTMKVARKLLPSQPNYTLRGLYERIRFKVPEDNTKAHDALGDVHVMIGLFTHLFLIAKKRGLTDDQIIQDFENITKQIPNTMPFGKYRGTAFHALPKEYVEWMLTQDDWPKDIMKAIYKAFPQYAPTK